MVICFFASIGIAIFLGGSERKIYEFESGNLPWVSKTSYKQSRTNFFIHVYEISI